MIAMRETRVALKELKPNPWRRLSVDPINDEQLSNIETSISQYGLINGVVCRPNKGGGLHIVCGHHRVAAAIKAGVTHATVQISEKMTDAECVRLYATENSTQRSGDQATSGAGTVAAATWLLARHALRGTLSQICESVTKQGALVIGKQIATHVGLGEKVVIAFLKGVPGLREPAIKDYFANIKSCGEYAKIIADVRKEIDDELAEQLRAAEAAEKERQRLEREEAAAKKRADEAAAKAKAARDAAEKKRAQEAKTRAEKESAAAKAASAKAKTKSDSYAPARKAAAIAQAAETHAKARPVTFDMAGVLKAAPALNKNPTLLREFRTIVTSASIRDLLPVANQAGLAQQLIKDAAEQKRQVTGLFIRERVGVLVLNLKENVRRADRAALKAKNAQERLKVLVGLFRTTTDRMQKVGLQITELIQDNPDASLVMPEALLRSLPIAKHIIDALNECVTPKRPSLRLIS